MTDTITLTGNIATEPAYKTTSEGLEILSFRLATSERRFDRAVNGWVDGETNWYSISLFRRLALHGSTSLRKGERVIVTGRLRLRRWEVDGRQGLAAEVHADAVGHDLRWGTTTFVRSSPPRESEQSTSAAEPEPERPGSAADSAPVDAARAWAAPDETPY